MPSRINFGSPLVVEQYGGMYDQPLRLSGPGGGSSYDYSQLSFYIDGASGFGFLFHKYSFEMDLFISSLSDTLTVFLDTPIIRPIRFYPSGTSTIGNYPFNRPFKLKIIVDLSANLWQAYIDDQKRSESEFNADTIIDLRINLAQARYGSVALDNVRVSGICDENRLILYTPPVREGLVAGSDYQISWFTFGQIDAVSLSYSVDAGLSWQTIAPSVENQGHYNWSVPPVSSETCLCRVADVSNTFVDENKQCFSIFPSLRSRRTMRFEQGHYEILYNGWKENGLKLYAYDFMYMEDAENVPYNGTSYISSISLEQRLEPIQDILFHLHSIDFAEYSRFYKQPIRVIGYKGDGNIVEQVVLLDGVIDGENDFETFMFNDNFKDLSYVKITNSPYCLDNVVFSFQAMNQIPIAESGDAQTVYACLDGLAEVRLDGRGSYDADGDVLSYSWYNDANELIAVGAEPNVVFGAGEHVIHLVVNDGIEDSLPDECVVTVIGAAEVTAKVFGGTVNPKSRKVQVKGRLEFAGEEAPELDSAVPMMLLVGDLEIEAAAQKLIYSPEDMEWYLVGEFEIDAAALPELAAGETTGTLVSRYASEQCVYGTDSLKVLNKGK